MLERNLKSTVLLIALSVVASLLLASGFLVTITLPLLGPSGLSSWIGLLILTLFVGRLTVTVTTTDVGWQSRKSIADAFVFLAIMLFAITPTNTAGPAALLAAIVGFLST